MPSLISPLHAITALLALALLAGCAAPGVYKTRSDLVSNPAACGAKRFEVYFDQDQALASELRASLKDRAENLMIVDLLRNDLGRVAVAGSVSVDALFEVEPRVRAGWKHGGQRLRDQQALQQGLLARLVVLVEDRCQGCTAGRLLSKRSHRSPLVVPRCARLSNSLPRSNHRNCRLLSRFGLHRRHQGFPFHPCSSRYGTTR